jgi:hypothetical protein
MHTQGIIKTVQYSKVHFKPWTSIEFVTQKESVMKAHKQLKNVYGVNADEYHQSSQNAGSENGQVEVTDMHLSCSVFWHAKEGIL